MTENYEEMIVFQTLGDTIYRKIIGTLPKEERMFKIEEAIKALYDDSSEPQEERLSEKQKIYVLTGMECAAHELGHDEEKYIESKLQGQTN